MKIRYRSIFNVEWSETDLDNIKNILTNPMDRYEIRLPCSHKKTFVLDGIRQCELCGDLLEITSYRD